MEGGRGWVGVELPLSFLKRKLLQTKYFFGVVFYLGRFLLKSRRYPSQKYLYSFPLNLQALL